MKIKQLKTYCHPYVYIIEKLSYMCISVQISIVYDKKMETNFMINRRFYTAMKMNEAQIHTSTWVTYLVRENSYGLQNDVTSVKFKNTVHCLGIYYTYAVKCTWK